MRVLTKPVGDNMNKEQLEVTLRALEGYIDNLYDTLNVMPEDEEEGVKNEIRIAEEVYPILSARLKDYE
jgi:hypothetical protein